MDVNGCLRDLQTGETGVILGVETHKLMKTRLYDMGLIPGTVVVCLGTSPMGDPKAYCIRGAVIAIRNKDAEKIKMEKRKEISHEKKMWPTGNCTCRKSQCGEKHCV